MKPPSVVVVGSSSTDMIVRVKQLPSAGETVLGAQFFTAAGGKGANQAVAAARAGARVSFVARVGRDTFGSEALAAYARDGVDLAHVTVDRQRASGVALIFLAQDGANCIGVASGANCSLSPAHVKSASSAIANAEVLLLQLESPLETVETAARLAHTHAVRVILNPAPARPLSDRLLSRVSILTPNESEAEFLTGVRLSGIAAAEKAARKLLRRGPSTVILTLGAKGALVASEQGIELVCSGACRRQTADSVSAHGERCGGLVGHAAGRTTLCADATSHQAISEFALICSRNTTRVSARAGFEPADRIRSELTELKIPT